MVSSAARDLKGRCAYVRLAQAFNPSCDRCLSLSLSLSSSVTFSRAFFPCVFVFLCFCVFRRLFRRVCFFLSLLVFACLVQDFYVEMKWSFSASFLMGSLMQAVAPSDTYRYVVEMSRACDLKDWRRCKLPQTRRGMPGPAASGRGQVGVIVLSNSWKHPGLLRCIKCGRGDTISLDCGERMVCSRCILVAIALRSVPMKRIHTACLLFVRRFE